MALNSEKYYPIGKGKFPHLPVEFQNEGYEEHELFLGNSLNFFENMGGL